MGSLGNTTLQFGLVTVGVSITSAAEPEESLASLCNNHPDPVRIKQPRICPDGCAEPDPVKGREVAAGHYQVLTVEETEELAAVGKALAGSIELAVCPREEVLAASFPAGSCYWLGLRDQAAAIGYRLLVELVAKEPKRAFVARTAVRGAPSLFLLEARGGALFLQGLMWTDRVRSAPEVPQVPVERQYLTMARQLASDLQEASPWDAAAFTDPRRRVRDRLLAGREVSGQAEGAAPKLAPVGDLRAQLQASLPTPAKAKGRRPAGQRPKAKAS